MKDIDKSLKITYEYLLRIAVKQKIEYDTLRDNGFDNLASALYEKYDCTSTACQVVNSLIKKKGK
jgi:hypothetical protein